MPENKAPVRVGVVGYGYAGRAFHSYLVGLAEGLELAAISTRDPDRRAHAERDYPGVKTYAQPSELFGDASIDLIVLATPHDTHRELAVEALEAGKNVVVDKVMAITEAECADMIRAADRAGKLLSVFHNRRWDGDFLTVRQVIETGLLGKLLHVEAGIYGYGSPRGWRGSREQNGGILYDWGAHLVDQALVLGGPVDWVWCASQFENPDTDIESWARCQIGFKSGVLYAVEVTNRARLGKARWYIAGDQGTLVKEGLDPQEAAMNRKEIEKAQWPAEQRARVKTVRDGVEMEMKLDTLRGDWRKYYQNIADALLKGAELAVKPDEVRRAVAVLETARRSAETGKTIHFGEDGSPVE